MGFPLLIVLITGDCDSIHVSLFKMWFLLIREDFMMVLLSCLFVLSHTILQLH